MPSIGGVSFAFVSRPAAPPGEELEEVTRPGVDGIALRKRGKRGEGYRLVGILGATGAEGTVEAAVAACMNLKGTIVDVLDDHAITWEDIAIMDVRIRGIDQAASVVGPLVGATKIITVDFHCKDTRTAPWQ